MAVDPSLQFFWANYDANGDPVIPLPTTPTPLWPSWANSPQDVLPTLALFAVLAWALYQGMVRA